MNKLLFFITIFIIVVASCNNENSIIGKWQMVGNGPIINFISDSAGSIEHTDSSALPKIESFKYHIKDDTLFEDTPVHLYGRRKWIISKLTKDSLIIHCNRVKSSYYRLK